MDFLGIPQSHGSKAMIVLGVCELLGRLLTSLLGDRFKGKFLPIFGVCSLVLSGLNIFGSFATNFTHMVIFVAGMCRN